MNKDSKGIDVGLFCKISKTGKYLMEDTAIEKNSQYFNTKDGKYCVSETRFYTQVHSPNLMEESIVTFSLSRPSGFGSQMRIRLYINNELCSPKEGFLWDLNEN